MGITTGAEDFRPGHAVFIIGDGCDVFLGDGLEETRPAGARIELGVGREEREIAADALVGAGLLIVEEGAAEGAFRAFAAADFVLRRRQTGGPIGIGTDNLVDELRLANAPFAVVEGDEDLRGFRRGGFGFGHGLGFGRGGGSDDGEDGEERSGEAEFSFHRLS